MLKNGKVHFISDTDRFAAGQPIVLKEDLSELQFQLESDNPQRHVARLQLSGLPAGRYTVRGANGAASMLAVRGGQEALIELAIEPEARLSSFTIAKEK